MNQDSVVDLKYFKEADPELDPEVFILQRIRELVHTKELLPGARLPSERALAETLSTSRGNVRKALQKLEFYGLVEISPQSGTRISSMRQETIEELMSSIPVSRDQKMADLMEARFILDVQCARLAAKRRTEADLKLIDERQQIFLESFYTKNKSSAYLEEDYLFHLAIANATRNHILVSLFSQLTPRIVTMEQPHLKQRDQDFSRIPQEHQEIINAIKTGDPDKADEAMTSHRNWALKRIFKE
ncbi:FadR/GntR family transcriptional regulator [Oceanispirochaeta sp.]|jgi:GntR family transcriptional repressor for pyruvate dehydrogenase complex|uniref:FadR/GntR family transcriptional regulator n=1 Tax=Oceanispirochaeta sp. TaxID=2035350 RepID=UPI00260F98A6|nr:FadR/GntR family transcriptional regulator [Oceanispirochaeta sp.]MDA3957933.1 FadR/GntR family transcriptional regulator [Oceanispirochaeta sp.]